MGHGGISVHDTGLYTRKLLTSSPRKRNGCSLGDVTDILLKEAGPQKHTVHDFHYGDS